MFDTVFHFNPGIFPIALPLVGVLPLVIFRHAALFATAARLQPRRPASGVDQGGQPISSDPVGERQAQRSLHN